MVMTMERDEQKHSKQLRRPGIDGMQFEGFAPVLTGEASMELCPLYLHEIGKHTFLRKLREKTMDAQDIDHVVGFLVQHRVQATKENVFRLWMGCKLDLLLEEREKRHGWQE